MQNADSSLILCLLAGLDHYGRLTDPMGVRMAEFPLSPMFAKMLLESGNFGCSKEIVTIAAMMQIQNIFAVPPNQKKAAVSGNRPSEGACCIFSRNAKSAKQLSSLFIYLFIFCYLCLQAREHRKFAVAEGDHLTMLNVYEAFIKV